VEIRPDVRVFFGHGGVAFLQGFLRKMGAQRRYFDGHFAVKCAAKDGELTDTFAARKICQILQLYFAWPNQAGIEPT
jgi:hypothetical protein